MAETYCNQCYDGLGFVSSGLRAGRGHARTRGLNAPDKGAAAATEPKANSGSFCLILEGGRARVRGRGGVQFEGVVRKNRSVPSLRQFTAQPISCGDLAYSFVFVFSSCCFPSQAFPFVVLENEKNAISPSSPL